MILHPKTQRFHRTVPFPFLVHSLCHMKLLPSFRFALLLAILLSAHPFFVPTARAEAGAPQVIQLVQGNPLQRNSPTALPSLIQHINEVTSVRLHPDPLFIDSFEDDRLLLHPLLYLNFGDRADWTLSPRERENLKNYLDRGGFLYIDAGITSEFLRTEAQHGQRHSFADWKIHPILEELFRSLYPNQAFERVPRAHPLFRAFYRGLPSPEDLPESLVDYVVNEKWPQGTYSFLQLKIDGRIAVLASPIVSMGWGRNHLGAWSNPIAFRVRESGEGLGDQLSEAAYRGDRYEAVREDGRVDVIYSQEPARPSWVEEPDGTWRIFRYYHSREISDFAHEFYTQLGVNVFIHALTH